MDNRKIGKLIAELRNRQKLTQQELGDKIGVGFRAVSKWECGQTLPDISNMKELSKIFGITLDELLAGKLKTDKKKLSKKTKIILTISSVVVLITIITTIALTRLNNQDKTYVYNLLSVDQENYTVKGQITFTEENISIVINELIFYNEDLASTKITNYEYGLISNNKRLVSYGYSPFITLYEDDYTINKFGQNFKITTTTEAIVERNEFANNELYLNINFIDENNEIINQSIKIKPSLVK